MLIVCPTCATSYEVEAASLSPAGRSVRCARCKEVWFASAPTEPVPAMATEAADTDADWAAAMEEAADAGGPRPDPSGLAPAPADDGLNWDSLTEPDGSGTEPSTIDPLAAAISGDAPPLVPDTSQDPLLAAAMAEEPAPRQDVESLAARRGPRSAKKRRSFRVPGIAVVILLLIAANAAVLKWRADVVRAFPQTASLFAAIGLPVNLRGLDFADVTVTRQQHEGVPVLLVEGLIVSVARTPVEVPRLRLAIKNDGGAEIYSWTTLPTRSILGPGEQLPFRSRLASPPAEGREVQVRFFNRRDLTAPTR
jgi:predicted Zn finger-like uncharacterized protein